MEQDRGPQGAKQNDHLATAWFATLQLSLQRGDSHKAAKALRELEDRGYKIRILGQHEHGGEHA